MAFNLGRVKDVTVTIELVKAYRKNPKEVTAWISDESQDITRGVVKLLREFLDDKLSQAQLADEFSDQIDESINLQDEQYLIPQQNRVHRYASHQLKKVIVKVRHNQRLARLLLHRLPLFDGLAWLEYDDDGSQVEADLADVQLMAILAD